VAKRSPTTIGVAPEPARVRDNPRGAFGDAAREDRQPNAIAPGSKHRLDRAHRNDPPR
jgi:hypothetical protein